MKYKINIKKSIAAGIAAGIVAIIIGTIIASLTLSFTMPYYQQSINVWKQMEPLEVWLASMYIIEIIEWIIFGLVFSLVYNSIPGRVWKKGAIYGFILWLVGTVTGMAMTYLYFAVPDILIALWLVQGLVVLLIAGAALAYTYDKLKWK